MHVEKQLRLGLFDPGLSVLDSVDLAPLLDLDFTQGRPYAHRIVNKTAATATRASSANRYWLQPADDVATNVLRYAQNSGEDRLNGLLIEGADQNVIIRNEHTSFNAADWTEGAAGTLSATAAVDLYGGGAMQYDVVGLGFTTQQKLLTAVKYVICCLVCKSDRSAFTANEFQLCAGAAPAIGAGVSTFEHLGNGIYLCWRVFTATAANWNLGIEGLPPGGTETYYLTCLSVYIAAPTNEGGDFPRSPIPNATGAAITRAADVYTHPGTNNIGTTEGTIDIECAVPCSEAAFASWNVHFTYYKDANNRLVTQIDAVNNKLIFYVTMGGAAVCSSSAATGCARGNILKTRLIYRQASTLDGANYGILYSNIGAGWSALCQSNTQPTGVLDSTGTIYIGSSYVPSLRWASFIRRVRIFNRAIVGVPAW